MNKPIWIITLLMLAAWIWGKETKKPVGPGKMLQKEVIVHASLDDVWNAWTTPDAQVAKPL